SGGSASLTIKANNGAFDTASVEYSLGGTLQYATYVGADNAFVVSQEVSANDAVLQLTTDSSNRTASIEYRRASALEWALYTPSDDRLIFERNLNSYLVLGATGNL